MKTSDLRDIESSDEARIDVEAGHLTNKLGVQEPCKLFRHSGQSTWRLQHWLKCLQDLNKPLAASKLPDRTPRAFASF